MFDLLDSAILKLLQSELDQTTVAQVAFDFATPVQDKLEAGASASKPVINLFLFDIQEHRDLRLGQGAPDFDPESARIRSRAPDLRVDCTYLITIWQHAAGTHGPETEHKLLGQILEALHRHPELPDAVLDPVLLAQPHPLRARVLRGPQLTTSGEFWRALGGTPRAALSYTVTLTLEGRPAPTEAGRPVDVRTTLVQGGG